MKRGALFHSHLIQVHSIETSLYDSVIKNTNISSRTCGNQYTMWLQYWHAWRCVAFVGLAFLNNIQKSSMFFFLINSFIHDLLCYLRIFSIETSLKAECGSMFSLGLFLQHELYTRAIMLLTLWWEKDRVRENVCNNNKVTFSSCFWWL